MGNNIPNEDAKPKTGLKVFSTLLFIVMLLVSFSFAVFGAASYNDSYSREADQIWDLTAIAAGGVLFLASVTGLLTPFVRKPAIGIAAAAFLVLSLCATIAMMVAGVGMLADSKHRGGDWAAVGVAASIAFGLICPAFAGLLTLGAGACLWFLRRR